jgi:O-antigen/teichoic acid export membrane protein
LVAKGRQNRVLWGTGLGTLANLAGNLLLIPRFGVMASAGTMLATEAVIFLSAAWCFRDRIGLLDWLRWLAPCLAIAAACLVLSRLLLGLVSPLVCAPVCVGVCALFLTVFKVMEKKDWSKLMPRPRGPISTGGLP